ncbi:hypothetical protein K438DRAFT_2016857 [Mycena galopus ATCC 62051]|nr:hypothetical protein K438DRAFT_2016857 [Mycena galopus ATCC 62051]
MLNYGRLDIHASIKEGVDTVSAAFLQLVESQECNQLDEAVPLLRLLLSDGYLAQDELLAVVDWDRLRTLAESPPSCHLAYTNPNDFSGIDRSDRSAEFLPPAGTTPDHCTADYQLYGMPTIGSAVQPFTIPTTPSTISSAFSTPRPETPLHPAEQPIEPEVHHSAEHQQSASHTPYTSVITDAAVANAPRKPGFSV